MTGRSQSAIVEAFSAMQENHDKKRKVRLKQWAKREAQFARVMGGTVGVYGDLRGIAGQSLQEIGGLEFRALALYLGDDACPCQLGSGTGRQGAGRTTCSWFQLPERLVFGLKFGSSLMMYSLDPFNQA